MLTVVGNYTFISCLESQYAVDMKAADDALNPDLRNYTEEDQKLFSLQLTIDQQCGQRSSFKCTLYIIRCRGCSCFWKSGNAGIHSNAIKTFRAIVTEMENLLIAIMTTMKLQKNLQDKTREVRRTLNSVSGDFIDAIRALTQILLKSGTNRTVLYLDVDNMVAFFEDKNR